MRSRCASNQAPSASRPSTPAQPKHQIPISPALHTAGSFLGDFPTPDGVRNSSRKPNGGFEGSSTNNGHLLNAGQAVADLRTVASDVSIGRGSGPTGLGRKRAECARSGSSAPGERHIASTVERRLCPVMGRRRDAVGRCGAENSPASAYGRLQIADEHRTAAGFDMGDAA